MNIVSVCKHVINICIKTSEHPQKTKLLNPIFSSFSISLFLCAILLLKRAVYPWCLQFRSSYSVFFLAFATTTLFLSRSLITIPFLNPVSVLSLHLPWPMSSIGHGGPHCAPQHTFSLHSQITAVCRFALQFNGHSFSVFFAASSSESWF